MTNFEAIKNYSLEEMAKFIAEHDKNCDIADGKYCSEICDQRVKGRCKHDECVRLDMTEEECAREWLKAERRNMTREEAIQILRTRIVPTRNWQEIHEAVDMAIEALSADAVQGEWKHTITWQPYCSNCEYVFGEDEEFSPFWKYCPMCGAIIKGGAE